MLIDPKSNLSHTKRTNLMAFERTFSIVKPDATKRNLVGQIVAKFEQGGLRVVAQKRIQLTLAQAQQFLSLIHI